MGAAAIRYAVALPSLPLVTVNASAGRPIPAIGGADIDAANKFNDRLEINDFGYLSRNNFDYLHREVHKRITDAFRLRAGVVVESNPDWLVWQHDNLIGSFRERMLEFDGGFDWSIDGRQELRRKLQVIGLEAPGKWLPTGARSRQRNRWTTSACTTWRAAVLPLSVGAAVVAVRGLWPRWLAFARTHASEDGAHTRSHPHLTRCDDTALRDEIHGCRKELEDVLGSAVTLPLRRS